MSSTLDVCGPCRDTCPKCKSRVKPTASHGVWACNECKRNFKSKCCVCGKSKTSGPSSIGPGKSCNSCYKMNTCLFCGKHN